MRSYLPAFAILAIAATPVIAQTAPAERAPEAKVKTVKKVVCQRIETDQETGSRLGATTKLCKTVVVPAKVDKEAHHEGHGAPQAR